MVRAAAAVKSDTCCFGRTAHRCGSVTSKSSCAESDGVRTSGEGRHLLRHTLCSHVAMRGAPARAIHALAGYLDLGTTQRDMHLSTTAIVHAIRLLEMSPPLTNLDERCGDIVETGGAGSVGG